MFLALLIENHVLVDLIYLACCFEINLPHEHRNNKLKTTIMKTNFAILTMCLLMAGLFTAAKEKGTSLTSATLTELGQFSISNASEAIILGNEVLKTYEIKYSNNDTPVLIGVQKTKKCKNFIVRTGNFEVEYVCKNHVFGVKKIDKEFQTVSPQVVNHLMDNYNFFTQRVITQYPKTEAELIELIASYFPSLIKEDHLAEL